MDIKEHIEQVIQRKGLQKSVIADRMGKARQNFNSLLNDPKWSVIEQVAKAMNMTVEQLLFDNECDEPTQEQDDHQHEESQIVGLIICPHCGKGIRLYSEKM